MDSSALLLSGLPVLNTQGVVLQYCECNIKLAEVICVLLLVTNSRVGIGAVVWANFRVLSQRLAGLKKITNSIRIA